MNAQRTRLALTLVAAAISSSISALPLSPIQRGDIAIQLNTVASGMAAPDYAFSPPGDTNRLFVVEQNGLLRVIQNGSLLPTPALNIQSLVAPPLVPSSANDER